MYRNYWQFNSLDLYTGYDYIHVCKWQFVFSLLLSTLLIECCVMVSNEADSLEGREEMKVEKAIHLLQSVTSRKGLSGGTLGPSSHMDGTDRGQYYSYTVR